MTVVVEPLCNWIMDDDDDDDDDDDPLHQNNVHFLGHPPLWEYSTPVSS